MSDESRRSRAEEAQRGAAPIQRPVKRCKTPSFVRKLYDILNVS